MIDYTSHLRPVLAAIQAEPLKHFPVDEEHPVARPFVTISREPGAGAWSLAELLANSLNRGLPNDDKRRWTAWDKELVEKVAADHGLSEKLIDSIEEGESSWLLDMLMSIGSVQHPEIGDEEKIYRRVAQTIQGLAHAGHVIVVGRGGAFITRRMRGGVHVRLVAPVETRVKNMAKLMNMSESAAAAHVRQVERNRATFYKRHWPSQPVTSEAFDLTINTASISLDVMVEMIRLVIAQRATALAEHPVAMG